ncbi:MAG: hypothetical protein JXR48_01900 [Candidatus Delongbacteria bacterium]|nr:hypothetical protein [Candidatus Delongbacteria bacterium]
MVKLKGSTLIEIIIALTIMIAIFTMSIVVFSQINMNNNTMVKTHTAILAQNTIAMIRLNSDVESKTIEKNGFSIIIDSEEQSKQGVFKIILRIKRNNKILYETNEIIHKNEK